LKPPRFEYHDPSSVDEALALLGDHGDESKVLAGGQSLVPLLNFRLAAPERIVDVNAIGSLAYLRRSDGTLRIGAMTRQSAVERSRLVASGWPLITEAMDWVAHPPIRNRGTFGGSAAHADPAAEIPAVLTALDARFHVRSRRGDRVIGADDFFVTHLTTALAADELLVEVEVPPAPERAGQAFIEFARRRGDFALGGAAVVIALDENQNCTHASIALLAAAPTPLRARQAEQSLIGSPVGAEAAESAARLAIDGLEPTGDIHGSSSYRKELLEVMVRRAVETAGVRAQRAAENPPGPGKETP
jgi:carbon-monoxide dehydrogenase medium subunit/6-hydroxypseudooxynicotine dehydrogenase subunit alpha